MGYFSWKASDTKVSIGNRDSISGSSPCYLLTPSGEKHFEDDYEGYGVFGGVDAYALLAEMNVPEDCNGDADHDRQIGINLAFGDKKLLFPIKIVEDPKHTYSTVGASEICPDQGFFYDEDDYEW